MNGLLRHREGELQFEVQHIEEVNVFAWIPITDI
jgi:hypothetical protein